MIEPWYDLKTSMSLAVGETLIHWSKNFHSYPPNLTADEWQAMLYMHGCTLKRYGAIEDDFDGGTVTAWEYFIDEDDVAAVEAKASMQWLTDNFHTLWD